MASKTQFFRTLVQGSFLNVPFSPEVPWRKITFSTTSQSSDGFIETMVDRAMDEEGWLHIDIENAVWVSAKYRAAPYNQPGGATLDDLEFERIRIATLAKTYNPDVMVGVYWSQNEMNVDGVFDVVRFERQQNRLDPFGDKPSLIETMDFISLGMYQSREVQTWGSYLNVAQRAVNVAPYWSAVPRVLILQNTNFYKLDEVNPQPYDLLLKKMEYFQDNMDPPPFGFDWASFQYVGGNKVPWVSTDPYVRLTREYASERLIKTRPTVGYVEPSERTIIRGTFEAEVIRMPLGNKPGKGSTLRP